MPQSQALPRFPSLAVLQKAGWGLGLRLVYVYIYEYKWQFISYGP